MKKQADPIIPKFLNINAELLELTLANRRSGDISIPTNDAYNPMHELIYFKFMYRTVYAEQKKTGTKVMYSLLPPPQWLLGIGTLMWQGILQGAAWDAIKIAISKAIDTFRGAGLAPDASGGGERKIEGRWTKYASSGRKQYEMYICLKQVYRELPDRHAEAYVYAGNQKEFGQIIRNEKKNTPATKLKQKRSVASPSKAPSSRIRKPGKSRS